MTESRRPGDHLEPEDPESGFLTDQEYPATDETDAVGEDVLTQEQRGATVIRELPEFPPVRHEVDLSHLDRRPPPGVPREYHFPAFRRDVARNGMTVIRADLPGRPLLTAQLLFDGGAAEEPPEKAGVTVLAARALTEGTRRRDAIELVEASERLGAELHAEAGWEALAASVEVPRSRFGQALGLLAEMVLEPSFPEPEVERLRAERLNDLMQARADPRRRIERVFTETIYHAGSPYSRPLAGTESTVPSVDRESVVARHARLLDPARATFIVAGDLRDLDVLGLIDEHLGPWTAEQVVDRPALDDRPHPDGSRVVVVDRPDSPQSELRVGHVGLPRRVPDFHAVSVLSAILGGLFNSRLQRLLREQRGYTYGVHSGFDMRRGAGPFAVRTAVETDATVPAIRDTLAELDRIRAEPVERAELDEARDYLVGVFPLRFEAAPQVVAAITSLVTHGLPDDELDRYRPSIAAVDAASVLDAARRHIRPSEASIVVIGDARRFEAELRDADVGPLSILAEREMAAPAG
jgi:zinc protease